jgi:hypothetical protein
MMCDIVGLVCFWSSNNAFGSSIFAVGRFFIFTAIFSHYYKDTPKFRKRGVVCGFIDK